MKWLMKMIMKWKYNNNGENENNDKYENNGLVIIISMTKIMTILRRK